MPEITITREIALRAVLFGACKTPRVGSRVSQYGQADLIWAERMLTPKEFEKIGVPLWTLSGYGDGSGSGSGYGSGYGSGDGYCSGSGYGSGSGDGYGYGYGSGYGYGYGDGYGSGSGYGLKIPSELIA